MRLLEYITGFLNNINAFFLNINTSKHVQHLYLLFKCLITICILFFIIGQLNVSVMSKIRKPLFTKFDGNVRQVSILAWRASPLCLFGKKSYLCHTTVCNCHSLHNAVFSYNIRSSSTYFLWCNM